MARFLDITGDDKPARQLYAEMMTANAPIVEALDANPKARQFFETLTGSTRYAFLFRLHQVRRPDRRAERIAGYIELLSAGKTLSS